MGETTAPTLKEEVGKYGSVNDGTQPKSPSAEKEMHNHHHHYPLFPGILYLAAFVVIYSANNAVLVKLFARGAPFTACPILCAGNVMGIITLFPIFHKDLRPSRLVKVPPKTYGWMLLSSVLSNVLGNLFYLRGLALTSVTATAILRRLEAANYLLVGALFLGDRPNCWVAFNGFLTVLAVVAALLYPHYFEGEKLVITLGYAYLLAGGWMYTLSLLVTKKYLVHVPIGILTCFKVTTGTILFHLLSMWEHGRNYFYWLYSVELWLNMMWYGPLFVTSLNILWLRALVQCSPTVLSLGMNMNFIVTVLWGIVVANDWPNHAEAVAGAVILISVLSGAAETVVTGAQRRAKGEEEGEEEEVVGVEEAAVVIVVEERVEWEAQVGEETLPLSGVVRRRKVVTVEDDNLVYGSSPKYC